MRSTRFSPNTRTKKKIVSKMLSDIEETVVELGDLEDILKTDKLAKLDPETQNVHLFFSIEKTDKRVINSEVKLEDTNYGETLKEQLAKGSVECMTGGVVSSVGSKFTEKRDLHQHMTLSTPLSHFVRMKLGEGIGSYVRNLDKSTKRMLIVSALSECYDLVSGSFFISNGRKWFESRENIHELFTSDKLDKSFTEYFPGMKFSTENFGVLKRSYCSIIPKEIYEKAGRALELLSTERTRYSELCYELSGNFGDVFGERNKKFSEEEEHKMFSHIENSIDREYDEVFKEIIKKYSFDQGVASKGSSETLDIKTEDPRPLLLEFFGAQQNMLECVRYVSGLIRHEFLVPNSTAPSVQNIDSLVPNVFDIHSAGFMNNFMIFCLCKSLNQSILVPFMRDVPKLREIVSLKSKRQNRSKEPQEQVHSFSVEECLQIMTYQMCKNTMAGIIKILNVARSLSNGEPLLFGVSGNTTQKDQFHFSDLDNNLIQKTLSNLFKGSPFGKDFAEFLPSESEKRRKVLSFIQKRRLVSLGSAHHSELVENMTESVKGGESIIEPLPIPHDGAVNMTTQQKAEEEEEGKTQGESVGSCIDKLIRDVFEFSLFLKPVSIREMSKEDLERSSETTIQGLNMLISQMQEQDDEEFDDSEDPVSFEEEKESQSSIFGTTRSRLHSIREEYSEQMTWLKNGSTFSSEKWEKVESISKSINKTVSKLGEMIDSGHHSNNPSAKNIKFFMIPFKVIGTLLGYLCRFVHLSRNGIHTKDEDLLSSMDIGNRDYQLVKKYRDILDRYAIPNGERGNLLEERLKLIESEQLEEVNVLAASKGGSRIVESMFEVLRKTQEIVSHPEPNNESGVTDNRYSLRFSVPETKTPMEILKNDQDIILGDIQLEVTDEKNVEDKQKTRNGYEVTFGSVIGKQQEITPISSRDISPFTNINYAKICQYRIMYLTSNNAMKDLRKKKKMFIALRTFGKITEEVIEMIEHVLNFDISALQGKIVRGAEDHMKILLEFQSSLELLENNKDIIGNVYIVMRRYLDLIFFLRSGLFGIGFSTSNLVTYFSRHPDKFANSFEDGSIIRRDVYGSAIIKLFKNCAALCKFDKEDKSELLFYHVDILRGKWRDWYNKSLTRETSIDDNDLLNNMSGEHIREKIFFMDCVPKDVATFGELASPFAICKFLSGCLGVGSRYRQEEAKEYEVFPVVEKSVVAGLVGKSSVPREHERIKRNITELLAIINQKANSGEQNILRTLRLTSKKEPATDFSELVFQTTNTTAEQLKNLTEVMKYRIGQARRGSENVLNTSQAIIFFLFGRTVSPRRPFFKGEHVLCIPDQKHSGEQVVDIKLGDIPLDFSGRLGLPETYSPSFIPSCVAVDDWENEKMVILVNVMNEKAGVMEQKSMKVERARVISLETLEMISLWGVSKSWIDELERLYKTLSKTPKQQKSKK